jgi:hypothetical protein
MTWGTFAVCFDGKKRVIGGWLWPRGWFPSLPGWPDCCSDVGIHDALEAHRGKKMPLTTDFPARGIFLRNQSINKENGSPDRRLQSM